MAAPINLSSTPVLVFVIGEHGDVIEIVCQSAEPGRIVAGCIALLVNIRREG
jgi:hypothetical protein